MRTTTSDRKPVLATAASTGANPAWSAGCLVLAICAGTGAAEERPTLAADLWRAAPGTGVCAGAYSEAALNGRDAGVFLRQGERWLATDAAEVNDAGVARMDGALDYGEPGLRLRAERAEVDLEGGELHAEDVQWVLTGRSLRGRAAAVRKEGAALRLNAAALTRCSPEARVWQVRAADLAFDETRSVVTARHVRVHVGAVPIAYLPYARFPVGDERASGFLFPTLRYERGAGVDLALPYYLNLAPNYDATLTPRHIAGRGTGAEAEFRHLGSYTQSSVRGAFLPSDDDYDGARTRAAHLAQGRPADAFTPADRWLWSVAHRARRGAWRTEVDFTAVSDDDYFSAMDSTLAVTSQVALRQSAAIRYARGGLLARISALGLDRLEPGVEPYRRLPEASLFYRGSLAALDWSVGTSWAEFRAAGGRVPAGTRVEGSRWHVEPRLRLPLVRDWGFLALAAGVRHTRYALDGVPQAAAEPERDIRFASLDGGLFFERALRGGGWSQTLEPHIRYFHQSYADQDHLPVFDAARLTFSYDQLFRDNRFAGVDRIGDADDVVLGVTSRLTDDTGRERLTARLGARRGLRRARVVLGATEPPPRTALAGDLGTAFGNVRLRATFAWDAERDALQETGFALGYRRDPLRVVNLGFRRRAGARIEQTDLSLHWPVAPRWRLFGRWNHDWQSGQTIESFAGLAYANCCLEVKVLGHKTAEAASLGMAGPTRADRGVLVEVVLRGLGGLGGGVDARLARGIRGFQPSPAL